VVLNSGFAMLARGKGECLLSYLTQVSMAGWLPVALTASGLEAQAVNVVQRLRQHFLRRDRTVLASPPPRGLSLQDDAGSSVQ
jgi:hypothetical protein